MTSCITVQSRFKILKQRINYIMYLKEENEFIEDQLRHTHENFSWEHIENIDE